MNTRWMPSHNRIAEIVISMLTRVMNLIPAVFLSRVDKKRKCGCRTHVHQPLLFLCERHRRPLGRDHVDQIAHDLGFLIPVDGSQRAVHNPNNHREQDERDGSSLACVTEFINKSKGQHNMSHERMDEPLVTLESRRHQLGTR